MRQRSHDLLDLPAAAIAAALLVLLILLPTPALAAQQQDESRTAAIAGAAEESPDAGGVRSAAYVLDAAPLGDGAIRIDGAPDEPAWEAAAMATDFVQLEPDEGAPASERTEARVLYGPDALYVAFRARDSEPDRIAGQLTRRDQSSYSDWVYVSVDSYFDRRTAFTFGVNPVGVKQDIYMYEDTREDRSWDAVWEAAARTDPEGWTAEFRIPYSQLRFDGDDEQTWGLNLMREIARHQELSSWAPLSQTDEGMVSRFGTLRGIRGIEPPNRMEVQPYAMARVERGPGDPEDPFFERTDPAGAVGADVKYAVTNNLTLNLTLNPDFGQVEADPGQVNLSAFETFFPERRPFFLEGRSIFQFSLGAGEGGGSESLFYSRRIGRAPQGEADTDGGWSDSPDNTTILGAWKLSGKTASGWSIGALQALTAEEGARVLTGEGVRRTDPVEPMTNYAMARVQKDLREGWSAVGLVATATHRDGDVADALGLRREAYSGGIDFRHRFGEDGDYRIVGNVLASQVAGSAEAIEATQRSSARYFQRPGADHVTLDEDRTSLGGWAAALEAGKWGGGFWRAAAFFQARSPGFEVNDLGFQRNGDYWMSGGFVGYHRSEPGEWFRRWNLNLNAFRVATFGGERIDLGGNVNGSFMLHNLWGGFGGVEHFRDAFSTAALRGGPALRTDSRWSGWAGFHTDQREAVQGRIETNWSTRPESGAWSLRLSPRVRWRPSGRANVSVGPFISWNENPAQWIENVDGSGAEGGAGAVDATGHRYLFGALEQTTAGLTGRMDLAFTPDLSLQLYAEPFLSSGRYDRFLEVADPRAAAFDDRFRSVDARREGSDYEADLDGDGTVETFEDPDFDVLRFRSNAVLRWEYRPGSTLFLVWSQARDGTTAAEDFEVGRGVRDLFGTHPRNVLMLKVSYWLSP